VWDNRLDSLGVHLVPANVAPGQVYWRLVEARWANEEEAQGKHNIFINVLDENGERLVGETVVVEWMDGSATLKTEDKQPPEYSCNFAMYGTLGAYTVYVDGAPSDKIVGLGLGDIERPAMKIHTCFYLTFRRAVK